MRAVQGDWLSAAWGSVPLAWRAGRGLSRTTLTVLTMLTVLTALTVLTIFTTLTMFTILNIVRTCWLRSLGKLLPRTGGEASQAASCCAAGSYPSISV